LADEGKTLFEQTCAACHGTDLQGTTMGPPFLDPIYAPNHHPDESFYAAIENGVQPHHWDFGPMPAQPSVSADDAAAIIAYVRSEQTEAGITEDPSHP
jgi:mono/diheme cytochrome c family protein